MIKPLERLRAQLSIWANFPAYPLIAGLPQRERRAVVLAFLNIGAACLKGGHRSLHSAPQPASTQSSERNRGERLTVQVSIRGDSPAHSMLARLPRHERHAAALAILNAGLVSFQGGYANVHPAQIIAVAETLLPVQQQVENPAIPIAASYRPGASSALNQLLAAMDEF